MTDPEQIEMLKNQHQDLESAIDNEKNRPSPDDLIISDLKRQKLRIKDELASLNAL